MPSKLQYRLATSADAPAIASLHTANWQRAYRGTFSDHYLDQEAPTERLQVWTERFAVPNAEMIVLLAEDEAGLQGFCCTFLNYGPDGHLLDNLHVASGNRGRGIGKVLMRKTAERVAQTNSSQEIYLWVLTSNIDAMAIYDHLGGRRGRTEVHHFAGGNETPALMMSWSVGSLVDL